MAFGLISLLVCAGIIMLFFAKIEAPQIQEGQKAQQEAQQISGRGDNGMKAMDSYSAQAYPPTGDFRGIQITDVTPTGPMDAYYGLKVGDIVVAIGGNDVTALGGFDMGKAELDEAYQNHQGLTVERGGTKMELPVGGTHSPLDQFNIPMH